MGLLWSAKGNMLLKRSVILIDISISDGCRNEVTVIDEKYRNEFVFTIIRMYH